MNTLTTVLGYPRIGPRRELKHALETYWRTGDQDALEATGRRLREETWQQLQGLDSVPGNTFSYYDQMLDHVQLFGLTPARFRQLGLSPLDTYFAMARGRDDVAPLELTKWFDTNYHYLVPELDGTTTFGLEPEKLLGELAEARALGVELRPVLIGPLTFLLLSKATTPDLNVLTLLEPLLDQYVELLAVLDQAGASWVQLDEPALAQDRTPAELDALLRAYDRLTAAPDRPNLLVATYFGDPGGALPVLAATAIEALAVDLVSAPGLVRRIAELPSLRRKTVYAGVVDGRNVWRTRLGDAVSTCTDLRAVVGRLGISTSCSLLHVPYDLEVEDELDPAVGDRLAFARQKVDEVVLLGRAINEDYGVLVDLERVKRRLPNESDLLRDQAVRERVAGVRPEDRQRVPYEERRTAQQALGLPALATTTIGSFPQTADVRRIRTDLRAGRITRPEHDERLRTEIRRAIELQEELGLDVLVHGEPERNDMVQYFAERLDGFATTRLGWVQSYGSRCVRPPILHGDVSRPGPITVGWTSYAQSLTDRPVKGMLTGPVTILAWSFVRDDQPLATTADQVALALRDEVADLVTAGSRVVQVDEPALRELLPLREADRKAYLDWSVGAFRLATGGAPAAVQVHTHLCYSEFGAVITGIDGLDADVTTIEAARSRMEVLGDLGSIGFRRGVGPGVYDIHSPRVPSTDEVRALIRAALAVVPADRLWINPDCGLKTRDWPEVRDSLRNLVSATREVRATLG
ncbi:5-methyltetrahydropteroyltriglutamate--homocysteine S-methyltransferase [Kribbella solani]|uniref:5-methyltetrahydropteroyltriglutamate--homocysteine methyltransferase n=1 Tax=Kribbella solani TaxID=236067 RepID=A0A841DNI2_9ACTN|nr:5-methyltetrahydropteroyltriglutamate--homocysteine methyltransferase [Kribbella solani]